MALAAATVGLLALTELAAAAATASSILLLPLSLLSLLLPEPLLLPALVENEDAPVALRGVAWVWNLRRKGWDLEKTGEDEVSTPLASERSVCWRGGMVIAGGVLAAAADSAGVALGLGREVILDLDGTRREGMLLGTDEQRVRDRVEERRMGDEE